MRTQSYLMPNDNRKSFYGKAIVTREDDGSMILTSYATPVMRKNPDGSFTRMWGGYSATTMRHVNAFMNYCGVNLGGKAWWDGLDVNRPYKF